MRIRVRWIAIVCLGWGLLEACNLPVASPPDGPYPRVAAATPDASLSIADQYLTDVHIVSTDSFDNLRDWRVEPAVSSLVDGVFQMTGTAFWHSHFSYRNKFSAGEGLML